MRIWNIIHLSSTLHENKYHRGMSDYEIRATVKALNVQNCNKVNIIILIRIKILNSEFWIVLKRFIWNWMNLPFAVLLCIAFPLEIMGLFTKLCHDEENENDLNLFKLWTLDRRLCSINILNQRCCTNLNKRKQYDKLWKIRPHQFIHDSKAKHLP